MEYDLMRASTYLSLLKKLDVKWWCLNIQNNDEKCFLWSILALLHLVQRRNHPDRVLKYQGYEKELIMSGVKYLVDIKILTNLNTKTTLVLMSMDMKIKKSSHYVLLPLTLQDILLYANIVYMTKPVKRHWKKTFGKMQDTPDTNNQAPRS